MAIAEVGGFMFHKPVLFIVYIDYGLKFSLTIQHHESRIQDPSMGPPHVVLFSKLVFNEVERHFYQTENLAKV